MFFPPQSVAWVGRFDMATSRPFTYPPTFYGTIGTVYKVPVGFQGVLERLWFQYLPAFQTPSRLIFQISRNMGQLSPFGFELPMMSSPGLNAATTAYLPPGVSGTVVDIPLELGWKVTGGMQLKMERILPPNYYAGNPPGLEDGSVINFVATILLGPAEIG